MLSGSWVTVRIQKHFLSQTQCQVTQGVGMTALVEPFDLKIAAVFMQEAPDSNHVHSGGTEYYIRWVNGYADIHLSI